MRRDSGLMAPRSSTRFGRRLTAIPPPREGGSSLRARSFVSQSILSMLSFQVAQSRGTNRMSTQNATSCSDFGISGSVEQRERRAASPGGASDLSGANGRTAQNGRRPEPAVTLSAGDVEAIAEATARKLVEFVGERGKTFGLVGPRELAEGLGVSLDYVYAHATELGAMRLGSGPKARIRFDLDRARQSLEARRTERPGESRRPSRSRRGAGRP